MTKCSVDMRR